MCLAFVPVRPPHSQTGNLFVSARQASGGRETFGAGPSICSSAVLKSAAVGTPSCQGVDVAFCHGLFNPLFILIIFGVKSETFNFLF